MRILSQDSYTEKYDIPYENVAITYSKYIEGRWRIYAQGSLFGINPNENFIQIAEYSTEEKAKKAMEMLHEAYTGTFFAQNLELPEGGINDLKQLMKHGYGCVTVVKDNSDVRFEPLNICFQFPADSEIEV